MLLAAVLAATLASAPPPQSDVRTPPQASCGVVTVGYRFTGTPGQEFGYGRRRYSIPADGSIELLADPKKTTYEFEGRKLPLDVNGRDEFGIRVIRLDLVAAAKTR